MEKTLGEKRVRTDFNVTSDATIDKLKQATALMIDTINVLKKPESDPELLRLIALAQTAYEEAAMWAVKAATFQK